MKQLVYIITIILATCSYSFAQPRERMERIHAIKVGFITDKVHLTSDQAAKFWPVYNRYEDEMRGLRKRFFDKYPKEQGSADEEKSRQFIEDNLEYQEAKLNISKKYKAEFLKVISAQQLAGLYEAERDFKRMLIQQLKERRGGKGVPTGIDR